MYADRFRIRHPGPVLWNVHTPHVDGGGIEKWEDAGLRACYESILTGDWRAHDPFDIRSRLVANTDIYGRPNQVRGSPIMFYLAVFKAFLGISRASSGRGKAG